MLSRQPQNATNQNQNQVFSRPSLLRTNETEEDEFTAPAILMTTERKSGVCISERDQQVGILNFAAKNNPANTRSQKKTKESSLCGAARNQNAGTDDFSEQEEQSNTLLRLENVGTNDLNTHSADHPSSSISTEQKLYTIRQHPDDVSSRMVGNQAQQIAECKQFEISQNGTKHSQNDYSQQKFQQKSDKTVHSSLIVSKNKLSAKEEEIDDDDMMIEDECCTGASDSPINDALNDGARRLFSTRSIKMAAKNNFQRFRELNQPQIAVVTMTDSDKNSTFQRQMVSQSSTNKFFGDLLSSYLPTSSAHSSLLASREQTPSSTKVNNHQKSLINPQNHNKLPFKKIQNSLNQGKEKNQETRIRNIEDRIRSLKELQEKSNQKSSNESQSDSKTKLEDKCINLNEKLHQNCSTKHSPLNLETPGKKSKPPLSYQSHKKHMVDSSRKQSKQSVQSGQKDTQSSQNIQTNTIISSSKKRQRDTPRFNDSPSICSNNSSENENRLLQISSSQLEYGLIDSTSKKKGPNRSQGSKQQKSESCKSKLIALENYQSASSQTHHQNNGNNHDQSASAAPSSQSRKSAINIFEVRVKQSKQPNYSLLSHFRNLNLSKGARKDKQQSQQSISNQYKNSSNLLEMPLQSPQSRANQNYCQNLQTNSGQEEIIQSIEKIRSGQNNGVLLENGLDFCNLASQDNNNKDNIVEGGSGDHLLTYESSLPKQYQSITNMIESGGPAEEAILASNKTVAHLSQEESASENQALYPDQKRAYQVDEMQGLASFENSYPREQSDLNMMNEEQKQIQQAADPYHNNLDRGTETGTFGLASSGSEFQEIKKVEIYQVNNRQQTKNTSSKSHHRPNQDSQALLWPPEMITQGQTQLIGAPNSSSLSSAHLQASTFDKSLNPQHPSPPQDQNLQQQETECQQNGGEETEEVVSQDEMIGNRLKSEIKKLLLSDQFRNQNNSVDAMTDLLMERLADIAEEEDQRQYVEQLDEHQDVYQEQANNDQDEEDDLDQEIDVDSGINDQNDEQIDPWIQQRNFKEKDTIQFVEDNEFQREEVKDELEQVGQNLQLNECRTEFEDNLQQTPQVYTEQLVMGVNTASDDTESADREKRLDLIDDSDTIDNHFGVMPEQNGENLNSLPTDNANQKGLQSSQNITNQTNFGSYTEQLIEQLQENYGYTKDEATQIVIDNNLTEQASQIIIQQDQQDDTQLGQNYLPNESNQEQLKESIEMVRNPNLLEGNYADIHQDSYNLEGHLHQNQDLFQQSILNEVVVSTHNTIHEEWCEESSPSRNNNDYDYDEDEDRANQETNQNQQNESSQKSELSNTSQEQGKNCLLVQKDQQIQMCSQNGNDVGKVDRGEKEEVEQCAKDLLKEGQVQSQHHRQTSSKYALDEGILVDDFEQQEQCSDEENSENNDPKIKEDRIRSISNLTNS